MSVIERLSAASQVFVPSIVLGELYYGANKSARSKSNITHIDNFALKSAVLVCDADTAFSRYERGEAKPLPAVLNLFRLLDRHPELLKEIKAA